MQTDADIAPPEAVSDRSFSRFPIFPAILDVFLSFLGEKDESGFRKKKCNDFDLTHRDPNESRPTRGRGFCVDNFFLDIFQKVVQISFCEIF